MSSSCNEKTALLATATQRQHIIVVPARKDPKDYVPIYTTADYAYGLTLEELLPYNTDPWWQTVRRLCFGCVCLTFLLTLAAALALAYFQSGAACRPITTTTTTTALPLPLLVLPPINGTLLLAT